MEHGMAGGAGRFAVVPRFLQHPFRADAPGVAVMGGVFVLFPEALQRLLCLFFRVYRHQVGDEDGFLDFRFFMKWLRRSRVGNKHGNLLFPSL